MNNNVRYWIKYNWIMIKLTWHANSNQTHEEIGTCILHGHKVRWWSYYITWVQIHCMKYSNINWHLIFKHIDSFHFFYSRRGCCMMVTTTAWFSFYNLVFVSSVYLATFSDSLNSFRLSIRISSADLEDNCWKYIR